ncbi:MAG: hypothetical protein JWM11_5250 [Planctomycetaceae bacterium]|nr:hypothetical protein [Planctomycetaceae bacterium]
MRLWVSVLKRPKSHDFSDKESALHRQQMQTREVNPLELFGSFDGIYLTDQPDRSHGLTTPST